MTLAEVCSNLFLFLATFRRQVRNEIHLELPQVRRKLLEIYAEQERLVRDDANLERLYEKVKYVLYVLADEVLINSNWEFAGAWQDQLLEWEFFKTRLAGEEFFVRLENEGEKDEALAEIYYLALCLGFTGKYNDDPQTIQDIKYRLYRMLPNRFTDQDDQITPDAYIVGEGAKDAYKPLINLGRVALICVTIFVGVIFAYIAVKKRTVREIKAWAGEMRAKAPPSEMDFDAYSNSAERQDGDTGGDEPTP